MSAAPAPPRIILEFGKAEMPSWRFQEKKERDLIAPAIGINFARTR